MINARGFLLLLCFIASGFISCDYSTGKKNEEETKTFPVIDEIIYSDSYLDENKIIGTWYVIDVNGEIYKPARHGRGWNPDVYMIDTIKRGFLYEFDMGKRFYDGRIGIDGLWTVKDNILIAEVILPINNGNEIIDSVKMTRKYHIEYLNDDYALFQYHDFFTGKKR